MLGPQKSKMPLNPTQSTNGSSFITKAHISVQNSLQRYNPHRIAIPQHAGTFHLKKAHISRLNRPYRGWSIQRWWSTCSKKVWCPPPKIGRFHPYMLSKTAGFGWGCRVGFQREIAIEMQIGQVHQHGNLDNFGLGKGNDFQIPFRDSCASPLAVPEDIQYIRLGKGRPNGWPNSGCNPSEKCSSNRIISPGRGENKTYLKPPPSGMWMFAIIRKKESIN